MSSLSTADHLEHCGQITKGRSSYLWSVKEKKEKKKKVCFCHTIKYAYMRIVVTVHLGSEFIIVETLELSFVRRVDFFWRSPQSHLTAMFVVLF